MMILHRSESVQGGKRLAGVQGLITSQRAENAWEANRIALPDDRSDAFPISLFKPIMTLRSATGTAY